MNEKKGGSTKKLVTIYLDDIVVRYFKELAENTGASYQTLINMYLVQCVKENKIPTFS